jgi:hypothetical protein
MIKYHHRIIKQQKEHGQEENKPKDKGMEGPSGQKVPLMGCFFSNSRKLVKKDGDL